MKDVLTQLIQRAEKLKEEIEKLESLEDDFKQAPTFGNYGSIQDQKELIEFLTFKLKKTVNSLGDLNENINTN